MLPERLSNGVCSLNPGVDRLTHSVFIQFTKDGRHKERAFRPNCHPERAPSDLPRSLRHPADSSLTINSASVSMSAWELASLLRRRRFEQGSLDLDFPEVKVRLDEEGKPIRWNGSKTMSRIN